MKPHLLTLALLAGPLLAADSWKPLFDGKSLDGWTQRGGKATYAVEDGTIVGTSVLKTPNSFLCTDREYSDFILEYEFLVDERLNSGVQIRSHEYPEEKTYEWNGKTIKVPAGRFHGYQIEIDPDVKRGRLWSAGIYDEARRGWLSPGALDGDEKAFSAQGRETFKPGTWNHVRIEAVGNSIRTWLNGSPRAAITDDMTASGYIGLQVHSIESKDIEGTTVKWRNLRIREVKPGTGDNSLTAEEIKNGWALLWDGTSTDGWRGAKLDHFPKRGWAIKDGLLIVNDSGGAESTNGGDIVTNHRFARFEMLFDFRMTPGANSGIKYFCQPNLDPVTGTGSTTNKGSAIGLEFQILDDKKHPDALLGRNGNRTIGSLYDLMTASADKPVNPPGEWNTGHIITDGKQVEHRLNGKSVLTFTRGDEAFRKEVQASKFKKIPGFGEWSEGHLLLQDHGDHVDFRNIKIRVPGGKTDKK
jgi:hypothetical protein